MTFWQRHKLTLAIGINTIPFVFSTNATPQNNL